MLQILAIYLLKMIVCSALLLSYYWIALRNKRFHYYNRFYLLLCVVLSIILPLLNLQWFTFKSNSEKTIQLFNVIYGSGENEVIINGNSSFNWQQLLPVLLFSISACLLFILVLRIMKLYRFKKIYPVNKTAEFDFINTDLHQAPFSFLKNIFWRNDISIDEPTGQQILQHELTHVKQKHTFDKLFMQIVLFVFWMNPVFWLIRSELYFIHEFIADEKAVSKDASAFAAMLLQAQFGENIFSPAQSFFYSPIKRRLLMLTTSKAPRFSYARRIMAMPLLAFVILLSAFKLQKETIAKTNIETQPVKSAITTNKNGNSDTTNPNTQNITFKSRDQSDVTIVGFVPKHYSKDTNENNLPYEVIQVEQEPRFPGGQYAWNRYLERNVNSDVPIKNHAVPGTYTVIVSFKIDENGNVSDVRALNDPGYKTADEAVRVIEASPKWVPAKNEGKKVSAVTKQKIIFQVQSDLPNSVYKPQKNTFNNNDQLDAHNTLSNTDNFKFTPPTIVKDTNFIEASFPGGHDAWQKFLQKNLNTNTPVDKGSPPGTYKVVVSFLVDANGKVSNVKAVNNPGYGTAEEAVRVIANGPDWVPAKNNNAPVNSMVKQDITFQVSEQ
jgi:hypothetical protein